MPILAIGDVKEAVFRLEVWILKDHDLERHGSLLAASTRWDSRVTDMRWKLVMSVKRPTYVGSLSRQRVQLSGDMTRA